MPPNTDTTATPNPENGFTALRRFLPYLWPKDRPGLRLRVVVAMLLVVAAKIIVLYAPFAYKAVIDRMAPGHQDAVGLALALVAGLRRRALRRPSSTICATPCSSASGRRLTRRLSIKCSAISTACRCASISSGGPGEVTKVIERGTKSIDTMLYFLLFNIAPTVHRAGRGA
jgi:hypothetical protein